MDIDNVYFKDLNDVIQKRNNSEDWALPKEKANV